MTSATVKVSQSISELFLITFMTATSFELSTEPASVSQLSGVIISVFIWLGAELAGLQS